MKLLCELSKLSNLNAFIHRILWEHWCVYSCLQIPTKENWFQYVRRVNATAISGSNFNQLEQAVQYNYRLCKWTPSFVHSSVLEFILNKRFFYFSEGKYFKPKLMHFQRSGLDFEGFREILKIPFPSSSIRSVLKVQQKKPVIHVPPLPLQ